MTIDTGQRSMRMQFLKLLYAILTGILVAFMFIPIIANYVRQVGISPMLVVVGALILYLAYQLRFIARDVEYLFVSDTQLPGMLRIRHFKLRPFSPGKYAIEMPLGQLHSFEERITWGGLRRHIVLRQQVEDRLYVYPPFSITILNRRERESLRACLAQYEAKR